MTDEPSNGELARGIAEIKLMLISRDRYESDQQGIKYRLDELSRDLDEERRERASAVNAANDRITAKAKAAQDHHWHWRELMWQGALPALATILGCLVALWAAHTGGH